MPNRRLRTWSVHVVRATVAAILAGAASSGNLLVALDENSARIEDRISELERRYSAVVEENARLGAEIGELREQLAPSIDGSESENPGWASGDGAYRAGYDDGFVIVPADPDSVPFSLKFNNQNMFRYAGFGRAVRTWTDNAGVVSPVNNRSNFEIPRGRAIFSGSALLPRLRYWLSIDYNTVTSEPIGFRGYSLSYEFSRSVEIHVGQNKVPGSREWLTTSLFALGPDRSLATTFFRPSLSQGVWFTGEPLDDLHYHAMLSNGFNTINTQPDELDNRFC